MSGAATFRAAARAGAYSLLSGFKTANPTMLHQIYSARPASFAPPLGFVGAINEPRLRASGQVEQRNPRVDVYLVQGAYENAEYAAKQDVLVDAFIAYVYTHLDAAGAETLIEPVSTEDVELTLNTKNGPLNYPATQIVLEGTASEGR